MSKKDGDYVGLCHKLCPVCGVRTDEGVTFHKRFGTVPRDAFLGWDLCGDHRAGSEEWLWLVEAAGDPNTSAVPTALTGQTYRIRRTVARQVFTINTDPEAWIFITPDAAALIADMARSAGRYLDARLDAMPGSAPC